ncbi:hypothetical protein ACFSQ7_46880 [Paenibacillus rhizoplanae]
MPQHYYNHSRQQGRSLAEPYNPSPYPGLSAYTPAPLPGEPELLPAYGAEVTDTALALPAAEASTAKAGGLLGGLGNLGSLANMEQIKGIVDRMGGIDGIVNTMGKVQKVMQGFFTDGSDGEACDGRVRQRQGKRSGRTRSRRRCSPL